MYNFPKDCILITQFKLKNKTKKTAHRVQLIKLQK